jgi:hypothetical protein
MPPFYELAVAHFNGQPPTNTTWAIAVVFTPPSGHSLIYRIIGTTANYSLEAPQSVTLKDGVDDYIGRAPVGLVDSEKLHLLHTISSSIPVIRGNPAWDSRNWVMEGIAGLCQIKGYQINKEVSRKWISEQLGGE